MLRSWILYLRLRNPAFHAVVEIKVVETSYQKALIKTPEKICLDNKNAVILLSYERG